MKADQQDNNMPLNSDSKSLSLNNKSTKSCSKKYPCPYAKCNKIFNEKGNLQTHIRIHVFLI